MRIEKVRALVWARVKVAQDNARAAAVDQNVPLLHYCQGEVHGLLSLLDTLRPSIKAAPVPPLDLS